MYDTDTIIAPASGRGNAALAVIRISGSQTLVLVEHCVSEKERFSKAKAREIHVYTLVDTQSGAALDEVTIIYYKAPASFTGEDMAEIICHGGEMVVQAILELFINSGARFAQRGEFTRRAFLSGKMNLVKAEAIASIIDSCSQKTYRNALENYLGKSIVKLVDWKNRLVDIVAEIEASIEFPEEDDIQHASLTCYTALNCVRDEIKHEIETWKTIKKTENGIIIPIIGIANAGKSSLMNCLLGYDRAIVYHQAGTTRDAIVEEVEILGEKVRLIDTAGLNSTNDYVEKIGIEKTLQYLDQSDIVLWVTPADMPVLAWEKDILTRNSGKLILAIINKCDIASPEAKRDFCIAQSIPSVETSLIQPSAKDGMVHFIADALKNTFVNHDAYSVIGNLRQEEALKAVLAILIEIGDSSALYPDEVLVSRIHKIFDWFRDFSGETTNEEILNTVFSRFCIGK
jgi:tRNA modification GTPase